VALWWIRRYIADQDDWRREILKKLDEALDEHDECQKKLPEKFVAKSDFMQFMQMRSTEHGLINNRLLALENQQAALIAKIDVFMDDIKLKQQRLSDTFLAKEHEISKRIDNLVDSHRVSAGNGQ
jgi:predicted nuclease with TOPRIM domain